MSTKVLSVLSVIVGGLGVILTALVAFGVNVSPDQHTAIVGLGSLLLLVVGAWAHPDIPVGPSA
jgi:formate-dependent nitrite reductase membrane component NrfD